MRAWWVRVAAGVGVLAVMLTTATGAVAAPTFSAHGSVEQVYVTGLAPGAQMSLRQQRRHDGRHQAGHALGGLLFRNVRRGAATACGPPPAATASGPLTVLSTQPAPPSTAVYNQSIPSSGYGYLTTRDGTKLAIDVHPPQDVDDGAARCRPALRCRSVPAPGPRPP